MNNVVLMGRLTKDPDIRYTQSQEPTCVARYTLAVDRRYKRDGEQSADFIPCIAFGKAAEFAEKFFYKGIKIIVNGRIQTGSYTKQDGSKVYTTDVIAENQEFAESKATSDQYQQDAGAQAQAPVPAIQPQRRAPVQRQQEMATGVDGFVTTTDDLQDAGLPFA